MRFAVIGAGGIGSATARFLSRDGHAVTVLEQFEIDHDRGGSWGASRIIRKTYTERLYTELMKSAYPLWEELERDSGESLFVRTGGLFFGPATNAEVVSARQALADNNVPFDVLGPAGVSERFPEIHLREDEIGVYEPQAGFLRASACVRANLRLARSSGAILRERTQVRGIRPAGDHVAVELAGGEALDVDGVVVAAGSWSQSFLAPFVRLPLVVSRQVYCHLRPARAAHAFGAEAFPVWIDLEHLFYGFPQSVDPDGVKVALHRPGVSTDPDSVDRIVHALDRAPLLDYCAHRLPGLSGDVLFEKVCLYANSPDEHFIVDRLADDPRIVVFAGDSGHAFKFSVLLGRILASLVCQESVPWELSRFSLARLAARGP